MTEETNSVPPTDAPSGLEKAILDLGGAIATLAKSTDSRTKILVYLVGIATALLAGATYSNVRTADRIETIADKQDDTMATITQLVAEQRETRVATKEASERAAEVAESAPRVEVTPATAASGGNPKQPARLTLVIPSRPKASADATVAPAVSVALPLPSALPVAGASSGGAP